MIPKPQIDDAPGLIWRAIKDGWEARWQARTDIINKGFEPKSKRIWTGATPTETEAAYIAGECRHLQGAMLVFNRGSVPAPVSGASHIFDGTYASLIKCYQTDPDSRHHRKEWAVRKNHDSLLARISHRHGEEKVADTDVRALLAWGREWSENDTKLSTWAAVRGQFRSLYSFGADFLKDADCLRMCGVMSRQRFAHPKPGSVHLKADQVVAHRDIARRVGYFSIALADAMQFDLMLRQKDVVGELVPISEPGVSDIHFDGYKWIKGARWEEVDEHFIFRHITSKRGKPIEADLHYAPMVMEELSFMAGIPVAELRREMFPASGPIIVSETKQRPWKAQSFRQRWRKLAKLAGLPDEVCSMHNRHGAITEATDAGALLEDVRHAATHSDISMTQRYSKGAVEKTAKVMKLRVEHRTKTNSERP